MTRHTTKVRETISATVAKRARLSGMIVVGVVGLVLRAFADAWNLQAWPLTGFARPAYAVAQDSSRLRRRDVGRRCSGRHAMHHQCCMATPRPGTRSAV